MNRMNVYYPNRKLGMEHAATPPEDAYAPVALANLQIGDTVHLHRNETLTVEKIPTDKQLVFFTPAPGRTKIHGGR